MLSLRVSYTDYLNTSDTKVPMYDSNNYEAMTFVWEWEEKGLRELSVHVEQKTKPKE